MAKAKKQPAMMFYSGDWLKDPAVRRASLTTRAIWVDLLMFMHAGNLGGEISGTVDSLARMVGATIEEMELFLEEAETFGIAELSVTRNAEITAGHKKVTVINRRMKRENKTKEGNRMRQTKHRNKRSGNGEVTPPSSSSSSSPPNNPPPSRSRKETDPDPPEVILTIPLRGSEGEFEVTADYVAELAESFPGLNIRDRMLRIRQWSLDNPERRKTRRGIRKHIASWLGTAKDKQDREREKERASPQRAEAVEEWDKIMLRIRNGMKGPKLRKKTWAVLEPMGGEFTIGQTPERTLGQMRGRFLDAYERLGG